MCFRVRQFQELSRSRAQKSAKIWKPEFGLGQGQDAWDFLGAPEPPLEVAQKIMPPVLPGVLTHLQTNRHPFSRAA